MSTPARHDRLNAEIGRLSKLSGPPKKVARATGHSVRREQQIRNGCRTGAQQRAAQLVHALAQDYPDTSPASFILGLQAEFQEVLAEKADSGWLTYQLKLALHRETVAQGPADVAESHLALDEWNAENLTSLIDSMAAHAAALIECMALARVIRAQL